MGQACQREKMRTQDSRALTITFSETYCVLGRAFKEPWLYCPWSSSKCLHEANTISNRMHFPQGHGHQEELSHVLKVLGLNSRRADVLNARAQNLGRRGRGWGGVHTLMPAAALSPGTKELEQWSENGGGACQSQMPPIYYRVYAWSMFSFFFFFVHVFCL